MRMLCSAAGLLLLLAACNGGDEDGTTLPTPTDTPDATPDPLDVESTAFDDGDPVPVRFTCDGEDTSPPLSWSGIPGDAAEIAILVDDPDAPGGPFVHWTLYELPIGETHLSEGETPAGVLQGTNDAGVEGYSGPCPPAEDEPHRYRFAVIALGGPSELDPGASPERFHEMLEEQATARGTLTGTYDR